MNNVEELDTSINCEKKYNVDEMIEEMKAVEEKLEDSEKAVTGHRICFGAVLFFATVGISLTRELPSNMVVPTGLILGTCCGMSGYQLGKATKAKEIAKAKLKTIYVNIYNNVYGK